MRRIIVVASLAVAGCSGDASYMAEHYGTARPEQHFVARKDGPRFVDSETGPVDTAVMYLITDKPSDGRMLINASGGTALASVVGRATLAVDVNPPIMVYRDAAQDYLRSKGRPCTTTEILPFNTFFYEVRYTCAAAPVTAPPRAAAPPAPAAAR